LILGNWVANNGVKPYSSCVIRTHIIPCKLPRAQADALNRESGRVYTGVLVAHWRIVRRKGLWLSQKAGTRWSDTRTTAVMHAHTIDAAQQGFYKACVTTRALRKAGFVDAQFPPLAQDVPYDDLEEYGHHAAGRHAGALERREEPEDPDPDPASAAERLAVPRSPARVRQEGSVLHLASGDRERSATQADPW
jgi:hypothetical protein